MTEQLSVEFQEQPSGQKRAHFTASNGWLHLYAQENLELVSHDFQFPGFSCACFSEDASQVLKVLPHLTIGDIRNTLALGVYAERRRTTPSQLRYPHDIFKHSRITDKAPVMNLNYEEAHTFAASINGRLPSEREVIAIHQSKRCSIVRPTSETTDYYVWTSDPWSKFGLSFCSYHPHLDKWTAPSSPNYPDCAASDTERHRSALFFKGGQLKERCGTPSVRENIDVPILTWVVFDHVS